MSITLVDDGAMRELNREYRGEDKPTDVLSFPDEAVDGGFPFILDAAAPRLLGDIVVSLDTAGRQAAKRGISLQDEVVFLTAHGMLHLLGWNDETPAELRAMLDRQTEILGRT